MLNNINKTDFFYDYYAQWITVYKEGAIRKVTMDKYLLTQSWIKRLAPDLKVCELTRITYQKLLNDYAKEHERQTTMDFHHQLKGAILDAVDEGLIERDPTRKAIIKGSSQCINGITGETAYFSCDNQIKLMIFRIRKHLHKTGSFLS